MMTVHVSLSPQISYESGCKPWNEERNWMEPKGAISQLLTSQLNFTTSYSKLPMVQEHMWFSKKLRLNLMFCLFIQLFKCIAIFSALVLLCIQLRKPMTKTLPLWHAQIDIADCIYSLAKCKYLCTRLQSLYDCIISNKEFPSGSHFI